MITDGIEAAPGREQSAVGKFFADALEEADDNFADAVINISRPEEALLFMLGYMEQLKDQNGNEEVSGLAICELSGVITSSTDDLLERSKIREYIWSPVFEAVKIHENPLHGWETMRKAVHLFDQAGEELLLR